MNPEAEGAPEEQEEGQVPLLLAVMKVLWRPSPVSEGQPGSMKLQPL
jgi:hypothetical protein